MYRKIFHIALIILLFPFQETSGQNPHGEAFKVDCKSCHNPDGWEIKDQDLIFNHDTTGFVLEGRHSETSCISCHETLVFSEATGECINCHTDVHNMSVGDDCRRCHTSENWLVDNIPELHEQNGFPLFGAHDMISCMECHGSQLSLQWTRIGNQCADCHMSDYQATSSPNHVVSGLSTECIDCHLPVNDAWTGSEGIFHAYFPLTEGHDIQDCATCHIDYNYAQTSSDCVDCHQTDYENTQNPNHLAANFSTDCAGCHTTLPGWRPATIGGDEFHDFFPLTLGHNLTECASCHNINDYADISNECASCHIEDFNGTQNPNHLSSNFSTRCTDCHTTNPGWTPTTLGEDFHNQFPLTLGHDIQDCAACHNTNDYADISNECSSCHMEDFNSTQNPDHSLAGFPTSCVDCHTTNPGWTPTSLGTDFHRSFPLTKGHDIQNCAACHNTSDFSDVSSECVSCHLTDFQSTSLPNHVASGFSQDCTSCHTTDPNWQPAEFRQHDNLYFPIYSGEHRGEWNNCFECHVTQSYDTFSCIDCHEHRKSKMDDEHDDVRNYAYESNACYSCHPNGKD